MWVFKRLARRKFWRKGEHPSMFPIWGIQPHLPDIERKNNIFKIADTGDKIVTQPKKGSLQK